MRIIEDKTETITVCGKCGSKFAYNKRDVQVNVKLATHPSSFVDGCEYYVTCPCCGTNIFISKRSILK